MNSRIYAILTVFLVLGAVMDVYAKVDVDDIDVTLSKGVDDEGDDYLKMDVGDDFYVHIELEDPDDSEDNLDVDIEIKINSVVVYDDSETIDLVENEAYIINISSKDFNEEDIWEDNLMAYDCGRTKVVVVVSGDIKPSESDEAELKIEGDDLEVDMDPEKPSPDDRLTITVKDEDDDEVDDVTVKFTHLGDDDEWDRKDDNWNDETDRNGEVEVKLSKEFDDPYGEYQIDVWEDGGDYCKYTTTIDSRRSLKISDPEPAKPVVGGDIKMRVTDDNDEPVSGAKMAVSGPGGFNTYTTNAQGYATFQVDSTGTFSIVVTKEGYGDSEAKHIDILEKNAMILEVTPGVQEVGKEISIKVTSSAGSVLKGAKVTIIGPEGTTESFTASDEGKVSYTPKSAGTYTLKADAPLYSSTTEEFKAHNVFKVGVPENLLPDVDITITVKDQEDKPVSGALVSIQDTGVSGTTDANGFTFSLTEPKEYTLIVKKEGYRDAITNIKVEGVLSLTLSSKEIDLGGVIDFVVQDSQGNPVTADVEVTKPDGVKEAISEGYQPITAGEYTLSASKSGYEPATDTFMVRSSPLVLESKVEGNNLVVTATSLGKSVRNISLSFDVDGFHEELLTNDDGQAILDLVTLNVTGNVTITAINENYAETSIIHEGVKPAGGSDYTLLFILILVLLVIAIIVVLVLNTGGGKEGKEETESDMGRASGSSLNQI